MKLRNESKCEVKRKKKLQRRKNTMENLMAKKIKTKKKIYVFSFSLLDFK